MICDIYFWINQQVEYNMIVQSVHHSKQLLGISISVNLEKIDKLFKLQHHFLWDTQWSDEFPSINLQMPLWIYRPTSHRVNTWYWYGLPVIPEDWLWQSRNFNNPKVIWNLFFCIHEGLVIIKTWEDCLHWHTNDIINKSEIKSGRRK